MHTQFVHAKYHNDCLGLVLAIEDDGSLEEFDFYELTEQGRNTVENCGRQQNIATIQHSSCGGEDLYTSAKHKVTRLDGCVQVNAPKSYQRRDRASYHHWKSLLLEE